MYDLFPIITFADLPSFLKPPLASNLNNLLMGLYHLGTIYLCIRISHSRKDFEITTKVKAFVIMNLLCALFRLWSSFPDVDTTLGIMYTARLISSFVMLISLFILFSFVGSIVKLPSVRKLEEVNQDLEDRIVQLKEAMTSLETARNERDRVQHTLLQSQKMEAVGQLTGGIAHDFNNLLQAIGGNLELIRNNPKSAKLDRWVGTGIDAVARAAHLTAQLLTFSRVQRLQVKDVAIQPMLVNLRQMVKRTIGPDITITLNNDNNVLVKADQVQLELAILNLSLNARDAMVHGGSLSITTHIDEDMLEIDVTDTGHGIPDEIVTRIFEPFFTTKDVGKGTGLGLSMVYGVAQQCGGELYIKKTSPEGTTFTISLPIVTATTELAVTPTSTPVPAGMCGVKHIHLIEDDRDVRDTLTEILSSLGHRVTSSEDGMEALVYLKTNRPDLLLVDYAMPVMNGAEVVKAAKLIYPDIPVAFVTGYSTSAALENNIVLKKPFRIDDIKQLLFDVFGCYS